MIIITCTALFLSTLSLRRATTVKVKNTKRQPDFYPRSPCGERRVTVLGIQHRTGISIHALLAESDRHKTPKLIINVNFYPRSPCGERQQAKALKVSALSISIHALLAESDGKE